MSLHKPKGRRVPERSRYTATTSDRIAAIKGEERTALSAELLLSQSRTDAATSLIAVYKALGAGWSVSEQGVTVTANR